MNEAQGRAGEPYGAMGASAKEAEAEFKVNPVAPADSPDGHQTRVLTAVEGYEEQHRLTSVAHRTMRWWAFGGIGVFVSVFLIALLCVLSKLLNVESISVVLASNTSYQWHALVFISVMVAVFAAIPLSLAMALVKMISDTRGSAQEMDLKTPTTELGKVILDLMRSVIAAAKN